MRRLIAMVVAAVICCVLFSPPSYSARWDPRNPPIPVDRQPNLDQPSGDDVPWGDPHQQVVNNGTGEFFSIKFIIRSMIVCFLPIDLTSTTERETTDANPHAEPVQNSVR